MSSYGALAINISGVPPGRVAATLSEVLGDVIAEVVIGDDDVYACITHDARDQPGWMRLIDRCHARVSAEFGIASLGFAVPRTGWGAAGRALFEAREALRLGERAFGPGRPTGYGDALLATFLLRHADLDALRSLHERALGKLLDEDRDGNGDLVATLTAYCDSGGSVRKTAERLGVHRNTVLHRMRRIRAVMLTNLEDGSSRVMLQVGIVAGRLVRPGRPSLHRAPA
ncbi:MAG TPA: helix-turn-helix domain-containing protein [Chloroflexota bacterium]